LKKLSQELLGASSRYQKLLKKAQFIKTNDPLTGLEIKRAVYPTEEQVLELLRNMKKEKEEKAKMDEIQKIAGSVDKL
jgi:hypothetical protein